MKYLICGLGNIGPEYENTRHNIGFMMLDELAAKHSGKFEVHKLAMTTEVKVKGKTLCLVKPTTYMNLSGKALNYWMQEYKVPLENVLVITDDLALPFAKLRMRGKGSNGGHNGLGNIQQVLGTDVYARLRVGVGNDFAKGKQVDYVLEPFSADEMKEMPFLLQKGIDATIAFASMGLERAMNVVNTK